MTNAERRNQWETRVAEYRASGESVPAWCAANEIEPSSMRYWLRKFRSEQSANTSSPQWLSVEVNDSIDAKDNLHIRVGKVVIEVQPGFDPALLIDVVRTLVAVC